VAMRGAGKRAFISGADISSFAKTRANAEAAENARATSDKLRHVMLHMEKPLIAMIRGYCLGGGLGMALNADIRLRPRTISSAFPLRTAAWLMLWTG
jgi:enoyl-CoA hydratase